ncbi:uncharacterized protein LOC141673948 [Apium graveolens]|uniref:uncharacterized protein LOC141673948 n=1 Tax=Apium graveolens TaxID=4045 RepID=UPI003D7B8733
MGGKVDYSVNSGRAPYVYRPNGQNHHVFGSLIPNEGEDPKFCQLYVYDTENEVQNRLKWCKVDDDQGVDFDVFEVHHSESGRPNNIGPSNEVAAIMVGDIDTTCDGYHNEIPYVDSETQKKKRKRITMKEYYAYKLQVRIQEGLHVRLAGRLYQQYVVDAFSCVEQARLWWLHTHQQNLRSDLYSSVAKKFVNGETTTSNVGKGLILPANFLGSKRYMQQNFQDALAVCRSVGHPDIFITMMCNPLWDEILQIMKHLPGCSPQDSPDIISRVFHLKLEQLLDDIKKDMMYVVEFQKRGFPHVHMLIWISVESKKELSSNIDKFVSAKLPDPDSDPIGFAAVKSLMMHGPCGLQNPKSPCMNKMKCKKHFPKNYCSETYFDQSGFPIYGRRKTGITVAKGKCELDNGWVVPYNRDPLVVDFTEERPTNWSAFIYASYYRGDVVFMSATFKHKRSYFLSIAEDCKWYTIRQLFVHIIVNCQVSDLTILWEKHWNNMVYDLIIQRRHIAGNDDTVFCDRQLHYFALAEIDKLLRSIGKSLKHFKQLPQPPMDYLHTVTNNLSKAGGVFFVYGSGGFGKTFLWKTIIYKLRSLGLIVLPVASSGIAATLMSGGRTAHSRFKIPIVIDGCSSCASSHDFDIAELIKQTSLIIWDEAPMQHRYAFECLDRSLRDIMRAIDQRRYNMPFRGITVVFGGDFRKILPVITLGSRGDVVSVCITNSPLWKHSKILLLHRNMRLNQGRSEEEIRILKNFADWVLKVGNGQIPPPIDVDFKPEEDDILIPPAFCDPELSNSIQNMIKWTYPDFLEKYRFSDYLSERAILTPTNQIVSHLNSLIVNTIPSPEIIYYSVDRAEDFGGPASELNFAFPPEYLNSISISGLPPHELKLKEGVTVMLM